jgi:hypothetical protein
LDVEGIVVFSLLQSLWWRARLGEAGFCLHRGWGPHIRVNAHHPAADRSLSHGDLVHRHDQWPRNMPHRTLLRPRFYYLHGGGLWRRSLPTRCTSRLPSGFVPDSRSQVADNRISSSVEKNLAWIAFLYFSQGLFCYLSGPLFISRSPRSFL